MGGTTTRFVYDRDNVALEFTGSAIPSVRYLHGTMVDQVLAQEKSGQTSWMLTDQLGSVRDLVSNAGAVVGHFTYDSFGQVVSAASTGTVDSRYKFTGRELDSETGLYYYRARYYDSRVGKFIGQDPIGFRAGDRNLYRYVGNGPLDATDPSGRLKYGQVNNTQARSVRYRTQGGGDFITGNITQVPFDGSAWITSDRTTAIITPSTTNPGPRPSKLPDPWGGLRDTDNRGYIVGHSLGGSNDKTNNFFAQDGPSNIAFYYAFERPTRILLDNPCVDYVVYIIDLYYPSGFQPYDPDQGELPLRLTGLGAYAVALGIGGTLIATEVLPYYGNP